MPKKFLKSISPNPDTLKGHKHFQWLGELLHNPNLWHFNRRAISGALALGLFCAFIPVPWQMVLAGLGAIYFHVNMPVSVATVWISNPLTMGPMFYGCYLVGAWFLNTPASPFEFQLSWEWLSNSLIAIWQPFLLGCLIVGVICSITGYVSIRIIWRVAAIRKWQRRSRQTSRER